MLALLKQVLDFELSVAEWVFVAVLSAGPYLVAGVLWAGSNTARFEHLQGFRLVVSVLGSIAFWPVLWTSGVCVG